MGDNDFKMDAATLNIIIQGALAAILALIEMGQQIYGKAVIPDLDDLAIKNAKRQIKIDAEKPQEVPA